MAVPLELKGLWLAHRTYGRAAWASLVSPAAGLARHGFPAHPYLINALNASSAKCGPTKPAAGPTSLFHGAIWPLNPSLAKRSWDAGLQRSVHIVMLSTLTACRHS